MSFQNDSIYLALPSPTGEKDVEIESSTVVTMTLSAKHVVTFSGVATAGYKQRVTATLANSEDKVVAKTVLEKTSGPDFQMLKTKDRKECINWGPYEENTTLKFAFQTEQDGATTYQSVSLKDPQGKKFVIEKYVTFINFATADGGGNDHHNTNFNVMIMPVYK